jgi:DNA (cytosine-5)-methyltransferase 1
MWRVMGFIDLFAGIGGVRMGFERAGMQCVLSSEWDKFAQITYKNNFGEQPHGDIRELAAEMLPDFDLLTGGFPCQPFSIAGVSKKNSLGVKHGFEDEKQGNLFFEIIRIIEAKQPKLLFLENVKNLLSHDKGQTWQVIRTELDKAGYHIFHQILDAKYYVPQHRERIFIVGFKKDTYPEIDFQFPKYPSEKLYQLIDILEKNPDPKYTLSDHLWKYLQHHKEKSQSQGKGFGFGLIDPEKDTHTRTMSARYYKDGSEILIAQVGKNPRRLTPREAARLQGFPEEFKIEVSDNQAYKQFGNSVAVPVIEAIAKQIVASIKNYQNGKNRIIQSNLF